MLTFDYSLVGTGWAAARLTDAESAVEVTASYLEDALGDLLLAVWCIGTGDAEARASWAEEPGEYRWVFQREDDRVRLEILAFEELYGNRPDSHGASVFVTEQPLGVVLDAFLRGAETVLAEWGEVAYRERWVDHDFPNRGVPGSPSATATDLHPRRPVAPLLVGYFTSTSSSIRQCVTRRGVLSGSRMFLWL